MTWQPRVITNPRVAEHIQGLEVLCVVRAGCLGPRGVMSHVGELATKLLAPRLWNDLCLRLGGTDAVAQGARFFHLVNMADTCSPTYQTAEILREVCGVIKPSRVVVRPDAEKVRNPVEHVAKLVASALGMIPLSRGLVFVTNDNMPARQLLAQLCQLLELRVVDGAMLNANTHGQALVYTRHDHSCRLISAS